MQVSSATAPTNAPAAHSTASRMSLRIDPEAAYGCVDWFLYQAKSLASNTNEGASATLLHEQIVPA